MHKYYIFISGLIIFVIFLIIGCFAIIGTPFEQKAINLDNQRLTSLNTIQSQITTYAYSNPLPQSLSQITALNSNYYQNYLNDPETKKPFEYKYVSATSYQLCATFSSNSSKQQSDYSYAYDSQTNKTYQKGYNCFTYGITPVNNSYNNDYVNRDTYTHPTPTPTISITPTPPLDYMKIILPDNASEINLQVKKIDNEKVLVSFKKPLDVKSAEIFLSFYVNNQIQGTNGNPIDQDLNSIKQEVYIGTCLDWKLCTFGSKYKYSITVQLKKGDGVTKKYVTSIE